MFLEKKLIFTFLFSFLFSKIFSKSNKLCSLIPKGFWTNTNYFERAKKLGIISQRFFNPYMTEEVEKEIHKIKTNLYPAYTDEDWANNYEVNNKILDDIFLNTPQGNLLPTYINLEDLTYEIFIEKYQKPRIPLIIRNHLVARTDVSFKVKNNL